MNETEAIHYLTHDAETGEETGHLYVPCSRYGRNGADCAPVAYQVATILARETGEELTTETLDYVMGLVVNDHDDVAYMLSEYGEDS